MGEFNKSFRVAFTRHFHLSSGLHKAVSSWIASCYATMLKIAFKKKLPFPDMQGEKLICLLLWRLPVEHRRHLRRNILFLLLPFQVLLLDVTGKWNAQTGIPNEVRINQRLEKRRESRVLALEGPSRVSTKVKREMENCSWQMVKHNRQQLVAIAIGRSV